MNSESSIRNIDNADFHQCSIHQIRRSVWIINDVCWQLDASLYVCVLAIPSSIAKLPRRHDSLRSHCLRSGLVAMSRIDCNPPVNVERTIQLIWYNAMMKLTDVHWFQQSICLVKTWWSLMIQYSKINSSHR